ncbi:MAG TPA: arsenate reductase (glutaredoxin) [Paucimonas sp.]|nr:arsenate reductase (glutaredoxin) [Paucimonas sp.]
MTDITIYHNPRCSKSRETLAIVERFAGEHGVRLHVVDYQRTPPTLAQLQEIRAQLDVPAKEMVRDNEEEFAALGLRDAGDDALLAAVARHPQLLQRPIVVYRGRAAIGRPPERIRGLLEA